MMGAYAGISKDKVAFSKIVTGEPESKGSKEVMSENKIEKFVDLVAGVLLQKGILVSKDDANGFIKSLTEILNPNSSTTNLEQVQKDLMSAVGDSNFDDSMNKMSVSEQSIIRIALAVIVNSCDANPFNKTLALKAFVTNDYAPVTIDNYEQLVGFKPDDLKGAILLGSTSFLGRFIDDLVSDKATAMEKVPRYSQISSTGSDKIIEGFKRFNPDTETIKAQEEMIQSTDAKIQSFNAVETKLSTISPDAITEVNITETTELLDFVNEITELNKKISNENNLLASITGLVGKLKNIDPKTVSSLDISNASNVKSEFDKVADLNSKKQQALNEKGNLSTFSEKLLKAGPAEISKLTFNELASYSDIQKMITNMQTYVKFIGLIKKDNGLGSSLSSVTAEKNKKLQEAKEAILSINPDAKGLIDLMDQVIGDGAIQIFKDRANILKIKDLSESIISTIDNVLAKTIESIKQQINTEEIELDKKVKDVDDGVAKNLEIAIGKLSKKQEELTVSVRTISQVRDGKMAGMKSEIANQKTKLGVVKQSSEKALVDCQIKKGYISEVQVLKSLQAEYLAITKDNIKLLAAKIETNTVGGVEFTSEPAKMILGQMRDNLSDIIEVEAKITKAEKLDTVINLLKDLQMKYPKTNDAEVVPKMIKDRLDSVKTVVDYMLKMKNEMISSRVKTDIKFSVPVSSDLSVKINTDLSDLLSNFQTKVNDQQEKIAGSIQETERINTELNNINNQINALTTGSQTLNTEIDTLALNIKTAQIKLDGKDGDVGLLKQIEAKTIELDKHNEQMKAIKIDHVKAVQYLGKTETDIEFVKGVVKKTGEESMSDAYFNQLQAMIKIAKEYGSPKLGNRAIEELTVDEIFLIKDELCKIDKVSGKDKLSGIIVDKNKTIVKEISDREKTIASKDAEISMSANELKVLQVSKDGLQKDIEGWTNTKEQKAGEILTNNGTIESLKKDIQSKNAELTSQSAIGTQAKESIVKIGNLLQKIIEIHEELFSKVVLVETASQAVDEQKISAARQQQLIQKIEVPAEQAKATEATKAAEVAKAALIAKTEEATKVAEAARAMELAIKNIQALIKNKEADAAATALNQLATNYKDINKAVYKQLFEAIILLKNEIKAAEKAKAADAAKKANAANAAKAAEEAELAKKEAALKSIETLIKNKDVDSVAKALSKLSKDFKGIDKEPEYKKLVTSFYALKKEIQAEKDLAEQTRQQSEAKAAKAAKVAEEEEARAQVKAKAMEVPKAAPVAEKTVPVVAEKLTEFEKIALSGSKEALVKSVQVKLGNREKASSFVQNIINAVNYSYDETVKGNMEIDDFARGIEFENNKVTKEYGGVFLNKTSLIKNATENRVPLKPSPAKQKAATPSSPGLDKMMDELDDLLK